MANAAQAMTLGGIIFLFVVGSPPAGGDAHARLDRRLRRLIAWSACALALIQGAESTLKVLLLLGTVDVTGAEAATSNFAIAGALQCAAAIAIAVLCASATPRAALLRLALGL